jgi:hypothetical protein
MTATDELRRLLDERGVEWEAFDDFEPTTQWSTHNGAFVYWARERDGKLLVETTAPFKCSISCTPKQAIEACTPEQAIAATLGDVPRLPHFWTHGGTLHIEATRMPTRIVVCEGGTCEFVPKRELDASEAENAKLRELAGELWTYAEQELLCDENCPYGDTCDWMEPTVVCVFKRRMRELGVEVDG